MLLSSCGVRPNFPRVARKDQVLGKRTSQASVGGGNQQGNRPDRAAEGVKEAVVVGPDGQGGIFPVPSHRTTSPFRPTSSLLFLSFFLFRQPQVCHPFFCFCQSFSYRSPLISFLSSCPPLLPGCLFIFFSLFLSVVVHILCSLLVVSSPIPFPSFPFSPVYIYLIISVIFVCAFPPLLLRYLSLIFLIFLLPSRLLSFLSVLI